MTIGHWLQFITYAGGMKIAGGPASFDLLDMATVLVRGLQQTAKLASFDRPLPEAHCKHHLNFIFESAAFLATCKDPSAGQGLERTCASSIHPRMKMGLPQDLAGGCGDPISELIDA